MIDFELRSGDVALVVRGDRNGWCRIRYAGADGESVALGAETFGYIHDHLLAFMRSADARNAVHYDYEGHRVVWILTLAEKHAALYGYGRPDGDGGKTIVCIEDGGNALPEIPLTAARIEEWLATLDNVRKSS